MDFPFVSDAFTVHLHTYPEDRNPLAWVLVEIGSEAFVELMNSEQVTLDNREYVAGFIRIGFNLGMEVVVAFMRDPGIGSRITNIGYVDALLEIAAEVGVTYPVPSMSAAVAARIDDDFLRAQRVHDAAEITVPGIVLLMSMSVATRILNNDFRAALLQLADELGGEALVYLMTDSLAVRLIMPGYVDYILLLRDAVGVPGLVTIMSGSVAARLEEHGYAAELIYMAASRGLEAALDFVRRA
jgi:hypothetical protein